MCIDFSEFNHSIRRERFQIPVAENIFGRMQGVIVLQILMLNQDFGRFLIYRSISLLTTIITPFGRFRCLTLPLGITSGPEIFREW